MRRAPDACRDARVASPQVGDETLGGQRGGSCRAHCEGARPEQPRDPAAGACARGRRRIPSGSRRSRSPGGTARSPRSDCVRWQGPPHARRRACSGGVRARRRSSSPRRGSPATRPRRCAERTFPPSPAVRRTRGARLRSTRRAGHAHRRTARPPLATRDRRTPPCGPPACAGRAGHGRRRPAAARRSGCRCGCKSMCSCAENGRRPRRVRISAFPLSLSIVPSVGRGGSPSVVSSVRAVLGLRPAPATPDAFDLLLAYARKRSNA